LPPSAISADPQLVKVELTPWPTTRIVRWVKLAGSAATPDAIPSDTVLAPRVMFDTAKLSAGETRNPLLWLSKLSSGLSAASEPLNWYGANGTCWNDSR